MLTHRFLSDRNDYPQWIAFRYYSRGNTKQINESNSQVRISFTQALVWTNFPFHYYRFGNTFLELSLYRSNKVEGKGGESNKCYYHTLIFGVFNSVFRSISTNCLGLWANWNRGKGSKRFRQSISQVNVRIIKIEKL